MVTMLVIFTMLLLVYRSVVTVVLLLITVFVELAAARGIVAFLGYHQLIGLSTFAVNLLVSLGIAAGTDYAIFFFGRYQEARQHGETREAAFYTMYHGVAHVVLASGLTIAGATFCLSFCRMPYFQTIGVPCAVGMLVAVAVALTLVPAVIVVGGRFGLFDPQAADQHAWLAAGRHRHRPVAAAHSGRGVRVALVGLLTLPGYQTSYNDRLYIPHNIPANKGYDAADRHFSQARMMPEVMMVESRSRPARSGGLPGPRQNRQGHLPRPRHLPRASDYAPRGHGDGAHVDPVPDQHAERRASADDEVPEGPHGRHAQAGRRARRHHESDEAHVRPHGAAHRHHAQDDR